MPIIRETPDNAKFNRAAALPYQLRLEDFALVMQDVYDFFFDVNTHLFDKGLKRLDEMLRPAAMSVWSRTWSRPAWRATPACLSRTATITATRT